MVGSKERGECFSQKIDGLKMIIFVSFEQQFCSFQNSLNPTISGGKGCTVITVTMCKQFPCVHDAGKFIRTEMWTEMSFLLSNHRINVWRQQNQM